MLTTLLVASAVTLAPIPSPQTERVPVQEGGPNYPCDQIAGKLAEYNAMARQHDQSVASFLSQVVGRLTEWHESLQPLEGHTQTIEVGTFRPIRDGADQIGKVTELAYENSGLLATEMDRIIVSLKQCSLK